MNYDFCVLSKKSLVYSRSSRFFPILSSRNFRILQCILSPVMHFELIFVKCIGSMFRFSFLKIILFIYGLYWVFIGA